MPIGESELILNADGSIYHLNLRPEDIATTIITVGDPDRVFHVSKYFDTIEVKKGKREFLAHTGFLGGKRLTVISTGIGTDNIDIVLNELDALVNIDFSTRQQKFEKTQLEIIRIGTSGAIQKDITVDSFLLSEFAVGFDGLLHFYDAEEHQAKEVNDALVAHLDWSDLKIKPYAFRCDRLLAKTFESHRIRFGMTATNAGFYGPQGRNLRLKPRIQDFHAKLASFRFDSISITNLEMETAGIYGLSELLGHKAVSLNAILANRANGIFSDKPEKTVDSLIKYALEALT